jgi:hypothetical protein
MAVEAAREVVEEEMLEEVMAEGETVTEGATEMVATAAEGEPAIAATVAERLEMAAATETLGEMEIVGAAAG